MFDLGGGELLLIVLAVLVLFGPKKLPELAQSLGRGMREFKRAQREFTEQINQAVSEESYKSKRGPELPTPDGAVARGATPAPHTELTEDDVLNTHPVFGQELNAKLTTSDPPSAIGTAPSDIPPADPSPDDDKRSTDGSA